MCIKEGMRCHNPVPNVARELTKPLVLDGVELLPGTAVNIQIGNRADSYCIKYKVPHHQGRSTEYFINLIFLSRLSSSQPSHLGRRSLGVQTRSLPAREHHQDGLLRLLSFLCWVQVSYVGCDCRKKTSNL